MLAVSQSSAIGYYKDPERSAVTFRVIDGTPYAMPGDWAIVHDDRRSRSSGAGPAASTPVARRSGPKRSKRC